MTTNSEGIAYFGELPPGPFEVSFTHPTLKCTEAPNGWLVADGKVRSRRLADSVNTVSMMCK
ncbi:MAG: hypothetical protein EXR72_20550 [Myxococcales bacterium]|nr:hypothetical protein [Myxococcales bacterium]